MARRWRRRCLAIWQPRNRSTLRIGFTTTSTRPRGCWCTKRPRKSMVKAATAASAPGGKRSTAARGASPPVMATWPIHRVPSAPTIPVPGRARFSRKNPLISLTRWAPLCLVAMNPAPTPPTTPSPCVGGIRWTPNRWWSPCSVTWPTRIRKWPPRTCTGV